MSNKTLPYYTIDNVQDSNDMIISIKLIQEAVGNLECGKSDCPDGIFAESIKFVHHRTHQLGPRYKGQLMSDGGAYSRFRSILLVLTHDFIIACVYGRTGSDGHERKDADPALRTILCHLRQSECCMLGAPSSQPTVPLHELPPARLLIHRQTSAHEQRFCIFEF